LCYLAYFIVVEKEEEGKPQSILILNPITIFEELETYSYRPTENFRLDLIMQNM
jgi:hypothetical protein